MSATRIFRPAAIVRGVAARQMLNSGSAAPAAASPMKFLLLQEKILFMVKLPCGLEKTTLLYILACAISTFNRTGGRIVV
jgi:hypothetical protein